MALQHQLKPVNVIGFLTERPNLVVERDHQLVSRVDHIRWVEGLLGQGSSDDEVDQFVPLGVDAFDLRGVLDPAAVVGPSVVDDLLLGLLLVLEVLVLLLRL